ncbi:MAG: HEPN domain-containing protein [Carboxydocellales bacterium]
MKIQRYFQPVSLIKFKLGHLTVDYPDDVFKVYLDTYAPKYIRLIIAKWENGKEFTDRDFYQVIKKAFVNPYKGRSLPEAADLATICGVEYRDRTLCIREDARQEVQNRTLRFCLEEILSPYTRPILEKYFPQEVFNLGYWQEKISSGRLELDQTVKIAYIFTLYNYLWDQDAQQRYGYFLEYYQTELAKRVSFIKQMWENRQPGEGLEYIPIFEDFSNLNPEKGAFMAQVISRILKSQNVQPGEKKIIEEALIRHAKVAINCRDEQATQIKASLITPVISEIVSLNKSQEFLQAAKVCLEQKLFNSVLNRCYYAMLRAARAALISFGYCKPWRGLNLRPVETHEEVLLTFQKVLIEEKGLFQPEQMKFIRTTLQKRLVADYADLETKARDASQALKHAQEFVTRVEEIINTN